MSDLLERLRAGLAERYLVHREIGSGGMAHVFLADDRKHRRKVAIKVLRPDLASMVGAERFLREIEIAARLSHPHILPLHDSGDHDGMLYYVMPFVEGESLRDRLERTGTVPVRDAVAIARDVADALTYAHRRGVVHRDIKPENILLSEGYALVADFGIARAISSVDGARLTSTGIALGTVHYMSPEQALAEPVDERSDIYSLGCVLYEMLAGRPPLHGSSGISVVAQLVSQGAPALATTAPGVDGDIARLVDKALAVKPEDRYANVEAFSREMSKLVERTVDPIRRNASTRRWLMVAAVAIIAAASVLALAWRSRAGSPTASVNRIAVLPFAVYGGSQVGYLREGIVDLLSRNLEGAEGLSAIDPATVMSSLVRSTPNAAVDVAAGRDLIRRVGAGAFVLGSVTAAGPTVRLQAAIYADSGSEAVALASVEGDSSALLQLVDRLAGQLLVGRRRDPANRLNQTAALTTHSLAALKEFLNAEQRLRGRAMDSAIAGYQRAIAQDSSFALAYYRLAVSAGWSERHALANEALAKGLGFAGRLSERDRRLVTAYAAFREGNADEAERQYNAILERYPDDLEAEFQLGDLLYQYNPLRGRPRLEARPVLDKVLALDPGFL